MATLTACVGSGPTAPPLASPRRTVAQSQPKDTKPRRSKRPLLDRASTYVPPTWQNGARCRFASSQAHLSSWPNPHSTRGTAAAHIPRFRALALFGRRPLERVDSPAIPASENLHTFRSNEMHSRGCQQRAAARHLARCDVSQRSCASRFLHRCRSHYAGGGRRHRRRAAKRCALPARDEARPGSA
jgi:hypothetical protein